MQPRAILFGYEGGLVDHLGSRFEVLAAVLGEEGIVVSAALLEAYPFGPPYESWLASVIGHARGGSGAALAPRLMVRAAARHRSLLKERGPAWLAGAVEFVERAAAAGLALGAVTELPKIEVAQALSGAGLAALLKVVVGAEDLEETASPRVAAYRLALGRLNTQPPLPERLIHPHEVASIEGSADGVRAAAEVGLVTIAIGGGADRSGADLAVGGFAGLELSRLG